jgi:hypothetical protein
MKRIFTYVYAPLIVIYLALSVVYPTDPATIARRGLSIGEARFIALTVAVPLVIVWLFAFYGSWRLKAYAKSIEQHPDGAAFIKLATGIQLIALYLPIRSVTKILLNFLAYHHPSLTTATNLIITYINVLIPLVAYMLIGQAAHRLCVLGKVHVSLRARYSLTLVFSILAVTFCYTSCSSDSLSPSDWLVVTQYNITPALRLLTIVIPYVFMWFVGLMAVYEIASYQTSVKGVFYRQSLRLLSIGLALEILASIGTQYVTAIASTLRSLPTGLVLSIAYTFLLVVAVAFIMIARGVDRIKKLEEV